MTPAAIAFAGLLTGACSGDATSRAAAAAVAGPFLGRVRAQMREAPGRGLVPAWIRAEGPPPAPPSGLRFESRVDVEGAGFVAPSSALARYLAGEGLRYGATAKGPPLQHDLERHRPHVTPGADFVALFRRLYRQARR